MSSFKMVPAILIALLPGLFAQLSGANTAASVAAIGLSAMTPIGPPSPVTIGCGSVIAGYMLPACPSTMVSVASALHVTVTELPIGGDGIGSTPSAVFNIPTAPSSVGSMASTTASSASVATQPTSTVTTILPPITRTVTVSEIVSNTMNTATALCYAGDSGDGILTECTKTFQGPIATNSTPAKSAAALISSRNLFKAFTTSLLWKTVFGSRGSTYHHVHGKFHPRGITRREMDHNCKVTIISFVFLGLIGIILIWHIFNVFRTDARGGQSNRWAGAIGCLLFAAVAIFALEAVSHYGHC